jgi:hypothetical protein
MAQLSYVFEKGKYEARGNIKCKALWFSSREQEHATVLSSDLSKSFEYAISLLPCHGNGERKKGLNRNRGSRGNRMDVSPWHTFKNRGTGTH